jgi:hypothetical protein
MDVPGSFSEFNEDEDLNSCALDPPREIWFTSYRFSGDHRAMFESSRAKMKDENPGLLEESENYIATAEIKQKTENGLDYFLLSSSNVTLGQRSVCTIVFVDPRDRDWAIRTWRSLKPPRKSSE